MTSRDDCTHFLQRILPTLGFRWRGFRRVRSQVCDRISRRLRELGLATFDDYERYLADHPEERRLLDSFCRITISRFFRDRSVFEALADWVLPELAASAHHAGRGLRALSLGCASGEEVYSIRAIWLASTRQPDRAIELDVIGIDAEPQVLKRAQAALYSDAHLRQVPIHLRRFFAQTAEGIQPVDEVRQHTEFRVGDIRGALPEASFDLVMCRNLAFTYFDEPKQQSVASRIHASMYPHGYLVVGAHEQLPEECLVQFKRLQPKLPLYRRMG